jgi:hypothetical protein
MARHCRFYYRRMVKPFMICAMFRRAFSHMRLSCPPSRRAHHASAGHELGAELAEDTLRVPQSVDCLFQLVGETTAGSKVPAAIAGLEARVAVLEAAAA